jgi:hypothetical protein
MKNIVLLCIFFLPSVSHAATASFMVREIPISNIGPIQVTLFIAEDTTVLNAVETAVEFDPSMLSFTRGMTKDSILQFWITYPSLCSSNTVCLSGITPGGFSGIQNEVVTLEFLPLASGTTTLSVKHLRALKHDGKGTDVPINNPQATLFISPMLGEGESLQPTDNEPPEVFTPSIIQDSAVYDGDWILIFSSIDKQSGDVHYFVKEAAFAQLAPFVPWKQAEVPYRLLDQSRSSYVFVKAVDESGNERIVVITPQQTNFFLLLKLTALFVITLALFVLAYRLRQQVVGSNTPIHS